jgi:hypothetical protein
MNESTKDGLLTALAEKPETYNGWKNYETWNVSLWIDNDQKYYRKMRNFCALSVIYEACELSYRAFIIYLDEDKTPDGVNWDDPKISHPELDRKIQEMAEDDFFTLTRELNKGKEVEGKGKKFITQPWDPNPHIRK